MFTVANSIKRVWDVTVTNVRLQVTPRRTCVTSAEVPLPHLAGRPRTPSLKLLKLQRVHVDSTGCSLLRWVTPGRAHLKWLEVFHFISHSAPVFLQGHLHLTAI